MMAPSGPLLRGLGGVLLLLAGLPHPTTGQIPDSLRVMPPVQEESVMEEEAEEGGITPRGAFIRSALIPGWGHAKVGAFVRGGFYFGVETTSALMIYKTQTRINRTENKLAVRESVVTARLERDGITDPTEVEAALAEDPEVEDLRALKETRSGQREDWVAFGLFLMLIGGVDAYVSAHLAEFPAAVVIEGNPSGGMEVGFSLPVGF